MLRLVTKYLVGCSYVVMQFARQLSAQCRIVCLSATPLMTYRRLGAPWREAGTSPMLTGNSKCCISTPRKQIITVVNPLFTYSYIQLFPSKRHRRYVFRRPLPALVAGRLFRNSTLLNSNPPDGVYGRRRHRARPPISRRCDEIRRRTHAAMDSRRANIVSSVRR
jgi:hypothetical protein